MSHSASQLAPPVPAAARTEAMLSMCILAAGFLLLVTGWSGHTAAPDRTSWSGPDISNQRMETLVGSLAFWVGSAALVWWLLSMSMAFLAAVYELRGQHVSSERLAQWTPAFMRRLALAVLSLTLLGAPGAHATTTAIPAETRSTESVSSVAAKPLSPSNSPALLCSPETAPSHEGKVLSLPPHSAEGPHPQGSLDPGWTADTSRPTAPDDEVPATLDRPPGPTHGSAALDPGWTPSSRSPEPGLLAPEPRRHPSARQTAPREVVVRPGDSLWALASRELGPQATDLETARWWPTWYSVNRDLIGPDPDHLLPGTVLRVPTRQ